MSIVNVAEEIRLHVFGENRAEPSRATVDGSQLPGSTFRQSLTSFAGLPAREL